MKRFIALLCLLLAPAAWATTTVSGKIQTLGTGNITSGAFVRFWLRGCAGNQPRVNGTSVIGPTQGGVFFFDIAADASGNTSGTVYSTRNNAGTGNGDIECGGSLQAVWYGMQVFVAGKGGPEMPVHAKSGATLDITQVTPITTNPTIVAPTGDTTYLRLDAGNSPVTANLSILGTESDTGGTHTGPETFSAAVNDTVTHALSNAGVFTNTQANEYVTSSINSLNPGAEYSTTQNNNNTTDALAGAVAVPVGGTVHQANGIAGYCTNLSVLVNCIGMYSQARAKGNNTFLWGANDVVDDCSAGYTGNTCNGHVTGTGETGFEIDVNVNDVTTFGQGLTIGGRWSAQPTNMTAMLIFGGGAMGTFHWNTGIWLQAGATTGGFSSPGIFLQPNATSGVNHDSQLIRLDSNDPVSGTNNVGISERADGNLAFTTSKANTGLLLNTFAVLARTNQNTPGGVQTQRAATGCTTAAAVGATCDTTVNLPATFSDVLYTPQCNGFGITSGVPVNGGIVSVANGSTVFRTVAMTAVAAQYTNIACFWVHD